MTSSSIEGVDELHPYTEPVGGAFGAKTEYARPKAPYDLFMESEGIPILREVGVRDIREMKLEPWARTGGNGAYVQLLGTEELWGMYVIEIPPGGALNPEHHLYEETFYVVEGRGSTEVWIGDDDKNRASFEWQAGALFSIPLNSTHRLVNATNKPARLVVATTAPSLMNHFRDNDFIFNSDYRFTERYDGDADFFEYNDALYKGGMGGRAMMVTSVIPDLVNTTLPLDNQRSPGYRRIEPYMANNSFYIFVGEHSVGKYAKGHYHPPSPVLICIKGEGYTYTWPRELGPTPWADGHGDKVIRQDYVAGGMVAAAPGGGDWYHQHFGVSEEPLRFLVYGGLIRWGAFNAGTRPGEVKTSLNVDIDKGGSSIAYYQEDPYIRHEFEESLARNGVSSIMPEELYQRPDGR
jgi:quercetin dioxygenase-like cupin family protein